ncbi:MAG: hypothetical protein FJ319_05660 [SAR202 cluster bacterium]|nr:hypothetical protein [SAR202 cluster bacterium]
MVVSVREDVRVQEKLRRNVERAILEIMERAEKKRTARPVMYYTMPMAGVKYYSFEESEAAKP